jgi:hypothetical protein
VKWPKKVALWLTNCVLFNSFIIYKKLSLATQIIHKKFLVQMAKYWAADIMEAVEPESDTDSMRPGPSTQPPSRPHGEPPGRLSGDMWKHLLLEDAMFVQLTKKE